jgi:hypothetical protein
MDDSIAGVCEVDEIYIGGKRKDSRGRSTADKTFYNGVLPQEGLHSIFYI